MADDIAGSVVDPDAGLGLDRRARDQEEPVAGSETGDVRGSGAEDGPVYGHAKPGGAARGERRWGSSIHGRTVCLRSEERIGWSGKGMEPEGRGPWRRGPRADAGV